MGSTTNISKKKEFDVLLRFAFRNFACEYN